MRNSGRSSEVPNHVAMIGIRFHLGRQFTGTLPTMLLSTPVTTSEIARKPFS